MSMKNLLTATVLTSVVAVPVWAGATDTASRATGAGETGVSASVTPQGVRNAEIQYAEAAKPEERQEFLDETERQLEEWGQKVGEFTEEARREADEASDVAARKVSDAWDTVERQWSNLKDASADTWEKSKDAFEDAWDAFQDSWNEAEDGKS